MKLMNINLEKIKLFCLSVIGQIYNSFPQESKKSIESSRYIISLTSYSRRFKTLHLTLESLLRQSLPPRNIYLWLSEEDIKKNKGVPKKILSLQKRGLIIIIKDENIRSYKKLSYIEEVLSPDISHVITADDDILYPKYWAKELIDTSTKHNCVSCFRGHNFIISNDIYDYKHAIKNNITKNLPSYNLIPTGCSGIAYPKNSISSLVSNKNLFQELSPDTDDIWYKMMTLSKNYKCCRVNNNNIHFPIVIQSLGDSLFSKNIYQNHNEINLKKTISYFNFKHFFKL
ncbi:hypothetical protein RG265_003907 [Providencia stuartii]